MSLRKNYSLRMSDLHKTRGKSRKITDSCRVAETRSYAKSSQYHSTVRDAYLAKKGFTLIEVLLALAIIAIALTALISVTAKNVANTQRLKEKTIRHWIANQGLTMIQLGLITTSENQEMTEVTKLFNQQWYWRVNVTSTPFNNVQKITIRTSSQQSGPFSDPLIGFRYKNESN